MKGRVVLKKIIFLILCFVLILSGCENLPKAEPYYTETNDKIVFSTQYDYYFEDESSIRCFWNSTAGETFYFHDTFELHILGDDGEWYVVGNEAAFNTKYRHGIDSGVQTSSRYEIDVYTDKLKEGEIYRISTYCFDGNENYYQVYAEFVCDNKLAEKEMKEVSGGIGKREDPSYVGVPEVLEGKG